MQPTFRSGDRLLVDYRAGATTGSVVLLRLAGGTVAVKRVTALSGTDVVAESDNVAAPGAWSGVVPRAEVLAVVRARVWPRPGVVRL